MAKTARIIGLLVVLFICLIAAGIVLLPFQRGIYQTAVSIFSPTHHVFQVQSSQRISVQIQPNPEGIEWLGVRWTENGKQVEIYNSRSQIYAEKLLSINVESGTTVGHVKTFERGEIPGLTKTLPFTLDDSEVLWGGCLNQDIFLPAKKSLSGIGNHA